VLAKRLADGADGGAGGSSAPPPPPWRSRAPPLRCPAPRRCAAGACRRCCWAPAGRAPPSSLGVFRHGARDPRLLARWPTAVQSCARSCWSWPARASRAVRLGVALVAVPAAAGWRRRRADEAAPRLAVPRWRPPAAAPPCCWDAGAWCGGGACGRTRHRPTLAWRVVAAPVAVARPGRRRAGTCLAKPRIAAASALPPRRGSGGARRRAAGPARRPARRPLHQLAAAIVVALPARGAAWRKWRVGIPHASYPASTSVVSRRPRARRGFLHPPGLRPGLRGDPRPGRGAGPRGRAGPGAGPAGALPARQARGTRRRRPGTAAGGGRGAPAGRRADPARRRRFPPAARGRHLADAGRGRGRSEARLRGSARQRQPAAGAAHRAVGPAGGAAAPGRRCCSSRRWRARWSGWGMACCGRAASPARPPAAPSWASTPRASPMPAASTRSARCRAASPTS
jgi:hypothetical protein